MRQVIYESVSAVPRAASQADDILRGARAHNGINGITGLLCAADNRYLQLLEGPDESVDLTMKRIATDPRHRDIVVLADRVVTQRAFADWAMAFREKGEPGEALDDRLDVSLIDAPGEVRAWFRQFAQ